MTIQFMIHCTLSIGIGTVLGYWFFVWQWSRRYPTILNPDIRELSFTTLDGGRLWYYFGAGPLQASPLTEELQNALEDVVVGAMPGSWLVTHNSKRSTKNTALRERN